MIPCLVAFVDCESSRSSFWDGDVSMGESESPLDCLGRFFAVWSSLPLRNYIRSYDIIGISIWVIYMYLSWRLQGVEYEIQLIFVLVKCDWSKNCFHVFFFRVEKLNKLTWLFLLYCVFHLSNVR